jgi:hypothetical protein
MRRPPPPQLLGFLTAYDSTIADMALALREIILDEVPMLRSRSTRCTPSRSGSASAER